MKMFIFSPSGQIPSEDPHWERNVALKKIICLFLFIWLCWVFVAMRGLFLVAVTMGYSPVVVRGLVIVVAFLVGEYMLWGAQASVIVARGL